MAWFGYLGLVEEKWPIIGKDDNWNREDWSMPPFARRPILGDVLSQLHMTTMILQRALQVVGYQKRKPSNYPTKAAVMLIGFRQDCSSYWMYKRNISSKLEQGNLIKICKN